MSDFIIRKKVYYHDTDCGQVVYYANYLKYFEEARTEFLAQKGINIKELQASGVLFAVRETKVKYKNPARYGESLDIFTRLSCIKNVTLEFLQYVKRETTVLVEADTQLVCINREFRPQSIPGHILFLLKTCPEDK